jgi:protein involved in polysaccharide export with SLBB domain
MKIKLFFAVLLLQLVVNTTKAQNLQDSINKYKAAQMDKVVVPAPDTIGQKGDRKTEQAPEQKTEPLKKSKVFGSELFSSASPLLVNNLSIATPANYVVGPGDELLLEVFGNNISSQKLTVSREGFINVKYAGLVNVNGITIQDLNTLLRSKLLKYYPSLASGGSKLQVSVGAIRTIRVSIVGAVKKPGLVTIPSLATLFNALYACGGPLENGSFRNIELIRNNKLLLVADLYDYLLNGNQSANVFLQDNDLIRVPYAKTQVTLIGELNREAIFETKPSESLSQLLEYAGGFKPSAYKGRVTGTRNTELEKEIIDVPASEFSNFKLQHGDSLSVTAIVDKFSNRVKIGGAVYKPGTYAFQKGMQLAELINKAQGIKEEAYTGRVNISRTHSDYSKENLSASLAAIFKGQSSFELQKEDSVTVYSSAEMKDSFTVKITGPVRNPGTYQYADSLSLQSLILKAGGFTDKALVQTIEIGRQKKNVNILSKSVTTSEIISVPVTTELAKLGADFLLQPNDVVSIKADPSKFDQITVKISGQVVYPGAYVLESRNDRLSKVLERASGLLPYADVKGAKLLRRNTNADTSAVKKLLDKNTLVKRDSAVAGKSALAELSSSDIEVAIDLEQVLKNPNSVNDIRLEDGDEIIVPLYKSVVTVSGEVLKPVSVQYHNSYGFRKYVSSAGGFSPKARRKNSFVVYTNGQSKRTKQFLGFKFYPRVEPGSLVVVPTRPEKDKFDAAKAGILISALSALATTAVLLFK